MDPGWYINEAVLPDIYGHDPIPSNKTDLQKDLCDIDIRQFGLPALADRLDKEKAVLRAPIVLQLTRYRNVSFPKIQEASHTSGGIIRVHLTDGHGSISAILLNSIKGIDPSTPPGTKILIKQDVGYESGFILLDAQHIKILGGHVEKLIEKWRIEQNSGAVPTRTGPSATSKAPKWISFGKKALQTDMSTKGFKANQVIHGAAKEATDESNAFEQQRKEQIEAAKQEATREKVFAAPQITAPVKPIISLDEQQQMARAKERERALKEDRGHDRRAGGRNRRGRKGSDDDEPIPAEFKAPTARTTLFDFLAHASGVPDLPPPSQPIETVQDQRFDKRNDDGYQGASHGHPARNRGPPIRHNGEPSRQRDHREHRPSPGQQGGSRPSNNQRHGFNNSGYPSKQYDDREQRPPRQQTQQGDRRPPRQQDNYEQRPPRQQAQHGDRRPPKQHDHYEQRTARQQTQQGDRRPPVQQNNYEPTFSRQKETQQNFEPYRQKTFENSARRDNRNQIENKMASMTISSSRPGPNNSRRGGNHNSTRQEECEWTVGAQCLAPWEDGKIYPATIIQIDVSGRCTVRYDEYGNTKSFPQGVLIKTE